MILGIILSAVNMIRERPSYPSRVEVVHCNDPALVDNPARLGQHSCSLGGIDGHLKFRTWCNKTLQATVSVGRSGAQRMEKPSEPS